MIIYLDAFVPPSSQWDDVPEPALDLSVETGMGKPLFLPYAVDQDGCIHTDVSLIITTRWNVNNKEYVGNRGTMVSVESLEKIQRQYHQEA